MPTSVETPDSTARNPDRPDHGGGVFSVLGVDLTALLAALLLILIAVSVFPSRQTVVASLVAYLPLHAVVQMFAIVVSILVFAVGWVAYSRERVGNSVVLSCAFLAVGFMDFAYTMAFPGMPDFVTPSSEGKAIDFWLAARGLAACALLYAAVRPWRPFASPWTRYWLLVAAFEITALVYWLVLYLEAALPVTFIPGQGPTPFKTGAEYTLIAVYMLAAAVFFARLRIERADYLRRLFTACCVIMLSELYFTFYWDLADINNLPGHLYNAIAYLLIYQALSVRGAQEPYQRLQRSRQPRRVNMERRRTGLVSDWWRVGLSPDWYREQDGEAAQAMLAAIVENSNTAIIGCALDRTILSWNAAAERMFGWSASEAIGQPIATITPQPHHGLLQPLFERAARGEPVGQVEDCYLRRDGTCIDTAGTLVAIRDANGDTAFFALTLWDITQQKQLKREVRQKAALTELLDALARAANESATSESTLQDCLERICDYGQWMLGRIGTFAPGQPKGVPQSSIWNCAQPARFDEFIRISNSLDHSLPSGRFTDLALREKKAVWASDFLAVSESGRLASAEKFGIRCGFVFPVVVGGEALAFLEFFADEVRDPDSAFLEAINSVASQLARVIERERAEDARAQFAAIVETSDDAIISRAPDGTVLSWNAGAEKMFGYSAAEMLGHNVSIIRPPHRQDEPQHSAWLLQQGKPVPPFETIRIARDGHPLHVQISVSAIRDAAGNVVRITAIIRNVTERKQAEQEIARLNQSLEQRVRERTRQLEAANKELEAFSYSVSHDLRAPLRGIDGFSQLLLKKYADHLDATGSDYLLRIRRASLRMGKLIDDLLQLSRVSRSQIKLEPVDLSRLARSILAELQGREPERMVVTEVQDGIELSADPRLLKIALENLLGNAWKFTGKNGEAKIWFDAKQQDGELIVSVKDNGAGFDMKFAHKLFGAFQRLHGATEFEGTGMGLATVQRILNLHGGRIWADATVGKGATFYFTLPHCVSDAIATPQKGEAA